MSVEARPCRPVGRGRAEDGASILAASSIPSSDAGSPVYAAGGAFVAAEETLPRLLLARAERSPDGALLNDVGGAAYTAGQHVERAGRWAALLRSVPVVPGETILSMQPTSCTSFEVQLAVGMVGAIEVPVNIDYKGELLARLIHASQARIAVVSSHYIAEFAPCLTGCPDVRHLVVIGDVTEAPEVPAHVTVHSVEGDVALPSADLRIEDRSMYDICTVLFTSGTTGTSKGVLIPWRQACETARWVAPPRAFVSPTSRMFSPFPNFHVSGKIPYYAAALGGGTVVLRERFSLTSFWQDVRTHGTTAMLMMGTTANLLLRRPPADDDADNPLEYVVLSPWIPDIERFKARFRTRATSVYNMTELSCPIIGGWEDEVVDDSSRCGRLRDGFDVRIVDEHDVEVPRGEPGELVIRSDDPWTLMQGYLGREADTVAAWRNLWFHTGDLFIHHPDGEFSFVGRRKDMIRRRGENVSAHEVESFALTRDELLEVAAVGIAVENGDEEILLAYVLKEGRELAAEDLRAFLEERLPRFMVPRFYRVMQSFPKTATGKIQKEVLRQAGKSEGTVDVAPTSTEGAIGDRA